MNDYSTICRYIDDTLAELDGYGTQLLLATKTIPQEILVRLAERYPQLRFGENRQQELCSKWFGDPSRWVFIGRLQTNKVKYLVDKVGLIESVDSLPLAKEIDRQASKHDLVMPVLVEINLGEEQKGGVPVVEAETFVQSLGDLSAIKVVGLMAVLPKDAPEAAAKEMKGLYDRLQDKYQLQILSMGMSGDYPIALRYGSTEVRLGSKIFGQRS